MENLKEISRKNNIIHAIHANLKKGLGKKGVSAQRDDIMHAYWGLCNDTNRISIIMYET